METVYIDQLAKDDRLIYFDWNIFKYLKNPRNDEDRIFFEKIKNLNVSFYYSYAHLEDLSHNYNIENRDKVLDDLSYISYITNNNLLWYDFRYDRVELSLNQIPQNVFDYLINEKLNKENSQPFTDSCIKTLKDFPEVQEMLKRILDIPIFSGLEKKNGEAFRDSMFGAKTMGEFMNRMYKYSIDTFSSPEKYKEIRHSVTELSSSKYIVKLYNDKFNTNEEKLTGDQIKELCAEMNIKLPNVIDSRYIELDMMSDISPEKINKKNSPQNLLNDLNHFDYAKFFSYYITEDKNNYKKSKYMIEKLGIETQVMNIEEFNRVL